MTTTPRSALRALHVPRPGGSLELTLEAIVAHLSKAIAERELRAAVERLGEPPDHLHGERVESAGPGNALWLSAYDAASELANVFSGVGERGVPGEPIARAVVERFLAWRASGTSVEGHLADQLMLPIAIAGAGSFDCDELTLHATTNVAVIRAFTGRSLRCFASGERRFTVTL